MPRPSHRLKAESFNFRVNADLKAAFTAATEAEDKPAAQVLRDFMRVYVAYRKRGAFRANARRQSLAVAAAAADPESDEAAVMRELEAGLDADAFAGEWR
ncbi:MAG: hypothetical protein ACREVV_14970 [Steroidobacteraceae bacterium]